MNYAIVVGQNYPALGGALGANLRYWLGVLISSFHRGEFPLGTFLINTVGSFLLGLTVSITASRVLSENYYLFFAVGVLGAFTTFSTFELDTFKLVSANKVAYAFLNAFGSLVAGYIALVVGAKIGR